MIKKETKFINFYHVDTIVLALLALFAFAQTSADVNIQELCEDEFLNFIRLPDDCTRFVMCMLGDGVLFRCDEGEIFDDVYRKCRPGDPDECVFLESQA
jgi:Chitin binding Peritrophin-A domain